ncbi:MAG: DUF58 domain-containing protein [Microthrixaceae bacterium]|nr:DUF58 domain-containing protein [Microthrixaceae bacterium]
MVDDTSSNSHVLSGERPHRIRRAGRTRRRYRVAFPTVFGAIVAATVISAALFRFAVADPSVVGLVWAGLASVAVIGVVFPTLSIGLLRIEVLTAPTDLEVGQLSSVEVELRGKASGLRMRCGRSPLFILDLTSPDTVKLPIEVSQRGVYDHIPIEASTDAPFSVLTASERRIVPLHRQLLVGPKVIPGVANIGEIRGDELETPSVGHAMTGDTVRSVRPYVMGDPSHMVHWPSSARLGSLVVRELEPPQTMGVAVVLALKGEPGSDSTEEAVSRAAGIVENALARGHRVMLCTATSTGPVAEEVANRLAGQRRLAMAEAGTPGVAPDGWPTQRVSDLAGEPEGQAHG